MTLLAATIKLAIDLYLGWRMVRAVDYINHRFSKVLRWLLLLLMTSFYMVPAAGLAQFLFGGSVDILTYPKPLLYLFWFGFAFSFQMLIWMLLLDIGRLVAHKIQIQGPKLDRLYGILVIGFTVLVLTYTGYKMYSHTNNIRVEQVAHGVEELPAGLDGFKIAHITDIQADRYTGAIDIQRYVEKVNAQQPDLVVVTGDLISYGTDYIEMAAEELSRIQAPYGTYFMIGDHDYWAGTEHVREALTKRGVVVLEGENRHLQVGDASVRLSGLTNVYSRKAPEAEIESVTTDTTYADLQLMLTHQVSQPIIEHSSRAKYNLLLAGHTHGGQIRVPLFFTRFSAPDFETEFVGGQYYEGDMLINVNNGLGFTLAPVRYNAPPNISIIRLERGISGEGS